MKKVVIVGVGALGSHVAMLLRNEAELRVVDFDKVEGRNTKSQFHGLPHLRKNKAESLKSTMNFLWATKIETIPFKLSVDNTAVLDHAALVIDCLDNGAGRRIIQGHVRKGGDESQLLHGALAPGGTFGRVIWDDLFEPDDAAEGAVTCEGGEFLPFIVLTAACVAYAAQQFLRTGKKLSFHVSPAGVMRI
jgi:molybdopterin/thiamine biosynthesis adenylyltransferase